MLSGYFHFGNSRIFPRKANENMRVNKNKEAVVLVQRTHYKYTVKVSVGMCCFKHHER